MPPCGFCACAGAAPFPLPGGPAAERAAYAAKMALTRWVRGPGRAVRALRFPPVPPGRPGHSPPRCGARLTGAAAVREGAEGPRPLLGNGPAGSAAGPGRAWGSPGGSGCLAPGSGLCFFRVVPAGGRSFSASLGSLGFCRGSFTVREGGRPLFRVAVSQGVGVQCRNPEFLWIPS